MADLRGQQLPNLKISVDNTESTDESDDQVESEAEAEISFRDDAIHKSEESEDQEELGEDDVEFNVRIGSFSDPLSKTKPTRDNGFSSASKSRRPKEDAAVKQNTVDISKVRPQIPEKRVYENKTGGFVTGIDVTSKEAQAKREQRAKRFRLEPKEGERASVQALFDSLDLKEEDFDDPQKGLRKEALHLRGTDDMSTQDIFHYFTEFPASGIEWINDTSCNVLWVDKVTAIRAMLKMSKSYKEVVAVEKKKKKEEKKKEEQKKKDSKVKEKGKASGEEDMTVEDRDDKAEGAPLTTSTTVASAPPASEEKMEVDYEDELDLTVDNDTILNNRAKSESDKTLSKETEHSNADCRVKEEKTMSKEKHSRSKRKDGDATKEGKKKKKQQDKEEGEDSDSSSSSSSSSSSGSSSSNSGSSSDSSSDNSDSSSSSGSSSGGSSSSDSESEDESKSKKKKASKARRDADTGELVKDRQAKKTAHSVPWPPGKWRLGMACKKARYLFMRFANQGDKKEFGAERNSKYYRKYGNPNYGGIKGLISSSRKRKIRIAKQDKELKSQGPDAREMIDRKRADRQRQEVEDREEGELSNDDIFQPERKDEQSEEEEEEEVMVVEKPKDLRQLLNRDTSTPSVKEERSLGKVNTRKRQREEDSEDEMDLDAELEHLMERPAKKKVMMRMHADEEEEKLKAKRSRPGPGLLTVVASDKGTKVQSRFAGRLGGRLGASNERKRAAGQRGDMGRGSWSNQGRRPHSEDDDEEEEEVVGEEMDDFARELEHYRIMRKLPPIKTTLRSTQSKANSAPDSGPGGDLRSRLGVQGKDSEKRSFPAMRIEVLDDEDDE